MTPLSAALVAVVLALICYAAYTVSRSPRTHRGDVLLLDLCFGLAGVTAAVHWYAASLGAF